MFRKIHAKALQKRGLEGIALRIVFEPLFCRIWGRLGPSRAPLGTILESSWDVWDRRGDVLARPWGGLGPSKGILRASWPRLGASWGRLGSNCKGNLDFRLIFDANFDPRNLKNEASAAGRARFFKNRLCKLKSIEYSILVPTLLYFGSF